MSKKKHDLTLEEQQFWTTIQDPDAFVTEMDDGTRITFTKIKIEAKPRKLKGDWKIETN